MLVRINPEGIQDSGRLKTGESRRAFSLPTSPPAPPAVPGRSPVPVVHVAVCRLEPCGLAGAPTGKPTGTHTKAAQRAVHDERPRRLQGFPYVHLGGQSWAVQQEGNL